MERFHMTSRQHETAAMFVNQTDSVGVELFSCV